MQYWLIARRRRSHGSRGFGQTKEVARRLHHLLDLRPTCVGVLVKALGHSRMYGVVAAVKILIARAALDPAICLAALNLSQDALLGSELLIELPRQFLAEVHATRPVIGDCQLAQQQVLGVIHAHQPKLDALLDLLAAPVQLLHAGRAYDGPVVIVVALDGTQVWQQVLVCMHVVVDGLRLVGRVDADRAQP